jgi:hypothetical protein
MISISAAHLPIVTDFSQHFAAKLDQLIASKRFIFCQLVVYVTKAVVKVVCRILESAVTHVRHGVLRVLRRCLGFADSLTPLFVTWPRWLLSASLGDLGYCIDRATRACRETTPFSRRDVQPRVTSLVAFAAQKLRR